MRGLRFLLVLLLLPTAHNAFAQSTYLQPVHEFQFQGAPQDRCSAFLLFETVVYQAKVTGPLPVNYSREQYINWELGMMGNTGRHTAFGVSGYLANDLASSRVAVLPRYRRWFSHQFAGDLSAGPFIMDTDDQATNGFAGGLARIALQYSDVVSMTAQVDRIRRGYGWENKFYVGLRGGSFVAIPASVFNVLLRHSLQGSYSYPKPVPVPPSSP